MNRKYLTAAAGITIAAGVLIPASLADAHTAQASIATAHCLSQGGWGATFSVTPTDLDKAPVATISGDASQYTITTFPYSTTVTDSTPDARTFHVHILWNDGFT